MPAQTPISLAQQPLGERPVEVQEVAQPAGQVRIATGTAQGDALQQLQAGGGRQPAVVAHPAIDAEQGKRQPAGIEADRDQMGERAPWLCTPKQMQMAVFAVAAMAVVIALAAAARIDQVARRVVLLSDRAAAGGEGAHQRPVAFDQAEPVKQRLACRSIAINTAPCGAGRQHQREGPQPPSWAPQPPAAAAAAADPLPMPGFALVEGEGWGVVA